MFRFLSLAGSYFLSMSLVVDEGDVVSLIECGKCEVLEESFTTQRNQFCPVGVCTRQAVRDLLQDVKHPSCSPLQNGIPEHLKEGSHPPPPSESNPQLQRADRLGPPIEQQSSSSSQTAGVPVTHPKHGETWSVSSMCTSAPGVLTPSDSFSLIRPSPGLAADHHLLRVQRHSLHDVFFVSTVSQPRLPPKFHVQVGLRDKRIQRTTTFFRRNYFIQDAFPSSMLPDTSIRTLHNGRHLLQLLRPGSSHDLADIHVPVHLQQGRAKLLSGGELKPSRVKESFLQRHFALHKCGRRVMNLPGLILALNINLPHMDGGPHVLPTDNFHLLLRLGPFIPELNNGIQGTALRPTKKNPSMATRLTGVVFALVNIDSSHPGI